VDPFFPFQDENKSFVGHYLIFHGLISVCLKKDTRGEGGGEEIEKVKNSGGCARRILLEKVQFLRDVRGKRVFRFFPLPISAMLFCLRE